MIKNLYSRLWETEAESLARLESERRERERQRYLRANFDWKGFRRDALDLTAELAKTSVKGVRLVCGLLVLVLFLVLTVACLGTGFLGGLIWFFFVLPPSLAVFCATAGIKVE